MTERSPLRIASGGPFDNEPIERTLQVAERGDLDYLVINPLAEASLAIAILRKRSDPTKGYDEMLDQKMRALLPVMKRRGFKIITLMGEANPVAAAEKILDISEELGIGSLRVGVVIGDDITERIANLETSSLEGRKNLQSSKSEILSAHVYLGCEQIVSALRQGADVVVTGRTSDLSQFLAPMVYEFDWSLNDWDRLAGGAVVGQLLECGVYVTGGNFADPGYHEVPRIESLGSPIAEVYEDGHAIISKAPGSGGLVTVQTCKEQLLYEVQNPYAYLQPDVVIDFRHMSLRQIAKDRVEVRGAKGQPRPKTLKVLIGFRDGFAAETMHGYAGPGAYRRAQLAAQTLRKRVEALHIDTSDIRVDYLGVNSMHGVASPAPETEPYEVLLRLAIKTPKRSDAEKFMIEASGFNFNAPSGSAECMRDNGYQAREVLGITSVLVPREAVEAEVVIKTKSPSPSQLEANESIRGGR